MVVDPGDPNERHEAYSGAVNLYAPDAAKTHVDDDESPSDSLDALFAETDVSPADDLGRVYTTARIEPGDEVYVLGTAAFRDGERVVHGGDGRFVVAGASQLRTFVYNAVWGVVKFAVGLAMAVVCGALLLFEVTNAVGLSSSV